MVNENKLNIIQGKEQFQHEQDILLKTVLSVFLIFVFLTKFCEVNNLVTYIINVFLKKSIFFLKFFIIFLTP